jgi:hypothetical protein
MHLKVFLKLKKTVKPSLLGNKTQITQKEPKKPKKTHWVVFFKKKTGFFPTLFKTASSAAPQIPLCREDAGIDPRTVATSALAVRSSDHSARSHFFQVLTKQQGIG